MLVIVHESYYDVDTSILDKLDGDAYHDNSLI